MRETEARLGGGSMEYEQGEAAGYLEALEKAKVLESGLKEMRSTFESMRLTADGVDDTDKRLLIQQHNIRVDEWVWQISDYLAHWEATK